MAGRSLSRCVRLIRLARCWSFVVRGVWNPAKGSMGRNQVLDHWTLRLSGKRVRGLEKIWKRLLGQYGEVERASKAWQSGGSARLSTT